MALTPTYRLNDWPALDKALTQLQNHDIEKAVYVGFKRAAGSFPGYMARAMNKKYNAKQRTLKNAIRTPRVTSSGGSPVIQIKSNSMPLSGRMFSPFGGVRWKDKKNAGIKVFRGGKKTPRKNGFRNPAFAKGGPFVRDGDSRTPVSKMMGPSFHSSFTGGKFKEEVMRGVEAEGNPKLENRVKDALKARSKGLIK
jgi:hypothetical protein